MAKVRSVLIVEDDETARFILGEVVKRSGLSEHYAVAKNGLEALAYLEKAVQSLDDIYKIPDIILLDLHMPMMNGDDFLDTYSKKFASFGCAIYPFVVTEPDQKRFSKWKGIVRGCVEKPRTKKKMMEIVEEYSQLPTGTTHYITD